MNIHINDIKNGMTVLIDNKLCNIIEFQHVKPGKGPAFVRIKLKNLKTGSTTEETFNTNIKLTKAHIEKLEMDYIYESEDNVVFMDSSTYEQIEIPKTVIADNNKYMIEGIRVIVEFFEKEIINITLPDKLEFEIMETEPAVKGNTSTNAMKDAKIATGYVVKVPLFINSGDKIIISTKDGSYFSRA
jgi:elongation factor P